MGNASSIVFCNTKVLRTPLDHLGGLRCQTVKSSLLEAESTDWTEQI